MNTPEYDTESWTRIGWIDVTASEQGSYKAIGIILEDGGWTELEAMGATPGRALRGIRREVEER